MNSSPSTSMTPRPKARSVQTQPKLVSFFEEFGSISILLRKVFSILLTTKFDVKAFIKQLELLGWKSMGMMVASSVFVGIVMTIQFIFTLRNYGAVETVGRIVGVSETRELAPSLTSLVVGCRVAAGIAAELGSMKVTEQIDAIRALGADPIRKLVVPRVLAGIFVMPMLTCFALVLGITSAMLVSSISYDIPMRMFIDSVFEVVKIKDFVSGISKTPVFGLLISLLGCYFGLQTTGGTAGVGRATTKAVVVVSVTVLVTDAVLTQLFIVL